MSLPIISAPMDTVTEYLMANRMRLAGGLGIVHRYNTIEEQLKQAIKCDVAGFALGVTGDFFDRARQLYDFGCRVFCIDVAHGHHGLVKHAILALKNYYKDEVHVMAGNVATAQGFEDLASWGADSVKVGIGGGSICSTRLNTGHGIPTLQSILDIAERKEVYCTQYEHVKVIADGGIKNSGDIVKALAAGADFVMLGSLLAGTAESPGEVIEYGACCAGGTIGDCSAMHTKIGKYKVYRGMASEEAQVEWKGSFSSREGITTEIPYKGPVKDVLEKLRAGIISGLSYSGARSIKELQLKARFIHQSESGILESSTHILNMGGI